MNKLVDMESIYFGVNPFGLRSYEWVLAVLFKSFSTSTQNAILLYILRAFDIPKLPTRIPASNAPKGLETFQKKDLAFLVVNQAIEAMFMMNLFHYAFYNEKLVRPIDEISLSNFLLPIPIMFVFDDFFYYIAHRLMHHPLLYAYCHKHHHRQSSPRRGYYDAANEHPLEQVIGLGILWFTFNAYASFSPTGLHYLGLILFVSIYATTGLLNHTEYDVVAPGVCYTVRAHEMHHRFPTCNFGQNTMLWDRWFGTFENYRGGQKKL